MRGAGNKISILSKFNLVDLRNLKFPNHPFLFAHADLNVTHILGHVQLLYVKLTISLNLFIVLI